MIRGPKTLVTAAVVEGKREATRQSRLLLHRDSKFVRILTTCVYREGHTDKEPGDRRPNGFEEERSQLEKRRRSRATRLTFPRLLELETGVLPISSVVVPKTLDSEGPFFLREELGNRRVWEKGEGKNQRRRSRFRAKEVRRTVRKSEPNQGSSEDGNESNDKEEDLVGE